jgi:spore maturation protein CgeB
MSDKLTILVCCPMQDGQSGVFIHDTLIEMDYNVAYFDWRRVTETHGVEGMNKELVNAINTLKPDITIIAKGIGIGAETIMQMRMAHDHYIVGWMFDCTLGPHEIYEVPPYMDMIKQLDTYYCFSQDNVEKLGERGVKTKLLPQSNYAIQYYPEIVNSVQKRKWGADVVFIGNVGGLHPNRNRILEKIWNEGIDLKLYGHVLWKDGEEPEWVKDCHTGYAVYGDQHNKVVSCSKIVLGIDAFPDRESSWSLRLYKVMGAGGFYLNTHTKGIDKVFKVGEEIETYDNEDDLIEKIMYYLQNDDKREEIAENGKKAIDKDHQQEQRLKIIIDDYESRG